jgi:hypothetical protein
MDMLEIFDDDDGDHKSYTAGPIATTFDLHKVQAEITTTGQYSFIGARVLPCFEDFRRSIERDISKLDLDSQELWDLDCRVEAYFALSAAIGQLRTEIEQTLSAVETSLTNLISLFRSYRAPGEHKRLRRAMHCQTMSNESQNAQRGCEMIGAFVKMMEDLNLDLPKPDLASLMTSHTVIEDQNGRWACERNQCEVADIHEDLDSYSLADLVMDMKRRKRSGKVKAEIFSGNVRMPSRVPDVGGSPSQRSRGMVFHLNTLEQSETDFEDRSQNDSRRLEASPGHATDD